MPTEFIDSVGEGGGVTYTAQELNERRRAGESDDQFAERQHEFAQKFAEADLESKLNMSDDPIGVLAKEIGSLKNMLSNAEENRKWLLELIDELGNKDDERPDIDDAVQFRAGGYNYFYGAGDERILYGEYNGPFSTYKKDETTITIRGGIVTGGNNTDVSEFEVGGTPNPDVGVLTDLTGFAGGLNYVYVDVTAVTGSGNINAVGYTSTTDPQDLDQATAWTELLAIVDYDSDNSKILRIIPRWDRGDIGVCVSFDVGSLGGTRTYYATRMIRGGDTIAHNH